MPIYEYACKACDKAFEVIQKFSDPPLTKCETCGKEVEKLISRSAFHLKGSGWYATDYKKASSSPASKPAEKAEAPQAAEGGVGGTGAKPCGGGACGA